MLSDIREPAALDLSCCNLEGVEPVPAIWLLEKHALGDVRVEQMGCCESTEMGGWEDASVELWKIGEVRKLDKSVEFLGEGVGVAVQFV